MKSYEFEGMELFKEYGIPVPDYEVVSSLEDKINASFPVVIKAQVLAGDRKKAGGVLFADNKQELTESLKQLLGKSLQIPGVSKAQVGEKTEVIDKVIVAEKIEATKEYYISFSFDSASRSPVLALSTKGGSGIADASLFPIDMLVGLTEAFVRDALEKSGFLEEDFSKLNKIIFSLWNLFVEKKVIVAEINPLLKTKEGDFFAADSKVDYGKRRAVETMGGDIAVIASGGGASLINMDALLAAGGKPANYAEYSGNPPKEVVTKLTQEVLSKPGLKACWVVGGTASFTDIYETMKGFLEGLKEVQPRPNFPFVIRRDGPRAQEAQKLLADFAEKEGFEFYIYGRETPMIETAKIVVDLAYKNIKPKSA